MARPLRIHIADGWYHVTARGIERRNIFDQAATYQHFLALLAEWVPRFHVCLHAYVLMPNHVHLVVRTPEANLSVALQWLKTSYSMWFNHRTQRVGPLFQGRYKAELLEGRAVAWVVTQYVHLNPVRLQRLGLSKTARRREEQGRIAPSPEQVRERLAVLRHYPWSSYPDYAGWRTAPEWLTLAEVLTGGGRRGIETQRMAYCREVERQAGQPPEALPPATGGLLRGGVRWVDRMRKLVSGDAREQGAVHQLAVRPDWVTIRRVLEQVKGEAWETFAPRYGDPGRDMALYILRRVAGLSLRAAGQQVGLSNYHATAQAVRRLSAQLATNKARQRLLTEVLNCIKVQT